MSPLKTFALFLSGTATMKDRILEKLFSIKDNEYKLFTARLIPNISPESIIGVRSPLLRALAKELKNDNNIGEYLSLLPHRFHEENMLHAFIINEIKDFNECLRELNRFLPYVNNWAVCDSIRPKAFKKNTDLLVNEVDRWLSSDSTYTLRFGIECLMTYFLGDLFDDKYLKQASNIISQEYYVNMMIAWYFATALAKQWESTIAYLENNILSRWVHNKTIQKATESYRITDAQKTYLRTLKR